MSFNWQESLLKLAGAVMGYFAARKLDQIIGRLLAVVTIAFEKNASEVALKDFRARGDWLVNEMAGKYEDWAEWRKTRKSDPQP